MKYNETRLPALSDISFKIPPGQKAALVGRTGAGKSSVFQALLQLYPTHGHIKIDGVLVSQISLTSLRS